mmetsp:Transcript_12028/g.18050  ORF Transcript_12028/g.18050 Transcript_12028/m.18050 type:complete len:503 (-) Transcript_12028:17-1525(-)
MPCLLKVNIFFCERFLDGGAFEKHNSNEGSVETQRLTPQIFSAASFWLTRGHAMVTDVQGVNDLYTDPCLHTLSGRYGGAGDLGARGMALFFESCDTQNPLFDYLKIPKFQLAPSQICTRRRTVRHATSSADLWKSVNKRRPGGSSLFKKTREASNRQLTHDDLDAIETVLDTADTIAKKALDSFLQVEDYSLPHLAEEKEEEKDIIANVNDLRKINAPAVAKVHAALAELETEAFFDHNKIDTAAAIFHCAKAAIKGSEIAAHSLARWHADLSPGALLPRFSDLKYAYPNKAGPLLVLAAIRGDAAAQFAAAEAFLIPRWGLPYNKTAAKSLLLSALQNAKAQDAQLIPNLQAGDFVLASVDGLPHKAMIQRVLDDGQLEINFDYTAQFDGDKNSLSLLPRSRVLKKFNSEQELEYVSPEVDDTCILPPGNAGADLPPAHIILAKLAEIPLDEHRDDLTKYKQHLLEQAVEAALSIQAPACANIYSDQLAKLLASSSSSSS